MTGKIEYRGTRMMELAERDEPPVLAIDCMGWTYDDVLSLLAMWTARMVEKAIARLDERVAAIQEGQHGRPK